MTSFESEQSWNAEYWMKQLERSFSGERRWFDAIEALTFIGLPAVPKLIEALDHWNVEVTRGVRKVLKAIGPETLPHVEEALTDADVNTRVAAAVALHAFGYQAAPAVPSLIRALDDHDSYVRHWVAMALAFIGWPAIAAIPALRQAIEREGCAATLEWMNTAVELIESGRVLQPPGTDYDDWSEEQDE
jgi:hypothetical protein